uniref:Putative lysine-specific demethylase JMJD5 n=1 Tax=Rhizophora mucronata TaxID=61149 RepID=A0A2P2L7T9_RHIMU
MSTTATNVAADGLSTPALDAESSNILQSISSHGGYAFVRMATLAASTGDMRAAEAARDMAWEQLHSGPWHSVLPVWRDAYSMACLQLAKSLYGKGEYKDALRALDMGLIMGGPLLREDLHSAVHAIVSANSESDTGGDGSRSSSSTALQFQDSKFPPQPHHSDDHAEMFISMACCLGSLNETGHFYLPLRYFLSKYSRCFVFYPLNPCLVRLWSRGLLYHWRDFCVNICSLLLLL